MNHEEIQKLFGQPLSELPQKSSLTWINVGCFLLGAIVGTMLYSHYMLEKKAEQNYDLARRY